MTTTTPAPQPPDPRATAMRDAAGWLLGAALVVATAYLRLDVLADRLIPLAYGLPLLICIWFRDVRLLYAIAVGLTVISPVKIFYVLPLNGSPPDGWEVASLAMQWASIWATAGALHALLRATRLLARRNADWSYSRDCFAWSSRVAGSASCNSSCIARSIPASRAAAAYSSSVGYASIRARSSASSACMRMCAERS